MFIVLNVNVQWKNDLSSHKLLGLVHSVRLFLIERQYERPFTLISAILLWTMFLPQVNEPDIELQDSTII